MVKPFLIGDLACFQMIPPIKLNVEIITSPEQTELRRSRIVNIITQKKVIDAYKASLDGHLEQEAIKMVLI